jgi:branched-chain amino acid aminotransferase
MGRFVIADGNILERNELNLTWLLEVEPFVLSQNVWFGYGGIPLFDENIDNFSEQIESLKLPFPKLLADRRELFRLTRRMLNKNKFYRSGIVQIQFFWHEKQINSVIRSLAFVEFDFPFSMHGLLVNFSELKFLSSSRYNRFYFSKKPGWNIRDLQLRNSNYSNSIVLNEKDAVCEGLFTNIFFVKGKVLFTPSPDTGCFIDVIRNNILEIAPEIGLKVMESKTLYKNNIQEMDEIFLCSEERGIQWILGVENKRYLHYYSAKIHEKLNLLLELKAKKQ